MLDGQIVAALIVEIKTQLGYYGITDADLRVGRGDQPTSQYAGAASGAKKYQVFISPVAPEQVGWSRQYSRLDENNMNLKVTHTKQKSYQVSCLVDFDPSNPDDMPAHDLAQVINDMLQQPDSVRTLRDKGVFVHECQPVRPAFVVNQSDNYESMPNFDMIISYNAEYVKPIGAVTDATLETNRV